MELSVSVTFCVTVYTVLSLDVDSSSIETCTRKTLNVVDSSHSFSIRYNKYILTPAGTLGPRLFVCVKFLAVWGVSGLILLC